MDAVLIELGALALALAIAGLLIARSKVTLGILLGLVPIAALALWLLATHSALSRQCLNTHCASANLPPECSYGREACAEEIGLRAIVFWAAGLIDLALYAAGLALLAVIHARRRRAAAARAAPFSDKAS